MATRRRSRVGRYAGHFKRCDDNERPMSELKDERHHDSTEGDRERHLGSPRAQGADGRGPVGQFEIAIWDRKFNVA